MKNKRKQREDLAESVGAELGDEAGQRVYNGDITIEEMTHHKTTLEEEATVE